MTAPTVEHTAARKDLEPMAERNAGNPNVKRAAAALGVHQGNALPKVTGETAPPAELAADQCVKCFRKVNLAEPVSHAMRGSHTCVTPAGTVAPYLDPSNDAERGATVLYHQRRQHAAQAEATTVADPTRPF